MSVLVEFPGGVHREVPAQLRQIFAQQWDGSAEFEQVPLNCDPHWKFERRGTRWVAVPRNGQLVALRPRDVAWWQFVDLMVEHEQGIVSAAQADVELPFDMQPAA
ncbi:hypothetical protein K663_16776 [Sphingobium sp. MI1205]|nr:hypothetical protein K663_16776 [Sphingobium sp. MI1205]